MRSLHATTMPNSASQVPLQQPVPQMPQWRVPDDIDKHIMFLKPGSTPQQRAEAFNMTVCLMVYRLAQECERDGSRMPGEFPPPNAIVKKARVGPFTVFYHSNYPPHVQALAGFMWNFYIGDGPAQSSIMPDWSTQGIHVAVQMDLLWHDSLVLTVLPSSRVRISYNFKGNQGIQDVIFPPNPYSSEKGIPVNVLE
ncbi:hypothetical protein B0H12DRAFT_1174293 [Mycena haematopus]|nr:hypothetical protein B0H12DRAFT_1174293 [Mycena haematopus]